MAGLKNVEAQVEDQRKLLYTTEIKLATQKQFVMDLKAELQKVKDEAKEAAWVAAQVAKESTAVVEIASYQRGVEDTENRLAEEVAGVCREYCAETWIETLNNAGIPTDSELRRYFFLNISEKFQRTSLPLLYPFLLLSRS